MEAIIYFLAFSVVTMGLILQFDKKQSVRINRILKETRDVQPLFLMRSRGWDRRHRPLRSGWK